MSLDAAAVETPPTTVILVPTPTRVVPDLQLKIQRAHKQRVRAIALTLVGITMTVVGIAISADAIGRAHYEQCPAVFGPDCVAPEEKFRWDAGGETELFFGLTGATTGIALTGAFGHSWSQANRTLRMLDEDAPPRLSLAVPVVTVSSPPISF